MALQSQKRTKSSKKRRAAHFALKKSSLMECANCGKKLMPHRICAGCGEYKKKGKVVAKKTAEKNK